MYLGGDSENRGSESLYLSKTYSCIAEVELETFCLEPSGLSMHADNPTIIRVIANTDNTFFIIFPQIFIIILMCFSKHAYLYHNLAEKCNIKLI